MYNPLFITPEWLKEYHTKYPHGYSVMENLIDWVNQVNELIDYVNLSPDKVSDLLDQMRVDGTLASLINMDILGTKASKSYVDSKVSGIASGSPRGVFQTVGELTTAYPAGNSYIYVVGANWYYWNGTVWTIGGEYLKDLIGALRTKPALTAADNINNVKVMGVYYLQTGDLPSNLPVDTGGVLIVFKPTADIYEFGTVQIFINVTDTFIRYGTSSGFREWQNTSGNVPIGGYDFTITKDAITKTMQPWTVKAPITDSRLSQSYAIGDIVKTIPYQSVFRHGRDILFNINLNAFYSMVANPASEIYTSGDFGRYGSVCTTLTDYLCGQDIYHVTNELVDVLDFYDYNGGSSLRIGDNMLKEGHSRIITDILIDSKGVVKTVCIAESGGPILYYRTYTLTEFEALLKIKGGDYVLGRFADYKARQLETVDYPLDCIPDKGHKSIYKTGETIKLTVNSGSTLYYRKVGGNYSSIPLTSLTKEIINGVNVYNISSLINSNGIWEVTSNPVNKPVKILRCTVGTVNVTDKEFSVSGYSAELKPLWYMVVKLNKDGADQNYGGPVGYDTALDYGNKHYITDESKTVFTVNGTHLGYYVRVMYKTPFGQTINNSNYVIL